MIAYAQERLETVLPDLQEMVSAQWQHTGDSDLPCEPNWPMYVALEQRGVGALFVARDNDRAIGYATALFHTHLNSKQVMVGTISTYFVEERSMRALIMRQLLLNARDWLLQRGARRVYIETDYGHSAGAILERMGFARRKIGYMLAVPNESGAALQ